MNGDFFANSWASFAPEDAMVDWAVRAEKSARVAVQDVENKHLLQCQGTWFMGLDALANDRAGRVAHGAPLGGKSVDFIDRHCGGWPNLHPAQVSVVYPGYPKPRVGENEAGFRYRLNRDAAHVDGILGCGKPKRRFVRELHGFIMGIPLTQVSCDAAPLVVWEGSHRIMQSALKSAFSASGTASWRDVDVTEIYRGARREVFETCPRTIVHGPIGSVLLVHRLALHGVAPWGAAASAPPEGRMIAYFRPELAGGISAWLSAE